MIHYYGKGMGKMYTGYDTSKTPMDQEYTGDTSSLNTDDESRLGQIFSGFRH